MNWTDTELTVTEYLKSSVKAGKMYFKSKDIAKEVGMTPKQVGMTLFRLSQHKKIRGLAVVPWSSSISTVWRVVKV
jgi:transcription initiation factor IIE alpha subunit